MDNQNEISLSYQCQVPQCWRDQEDQIPRRLLEFHQAVEEMMKLSVSDGDSCHIMVSQ